MEGKAWHGDEIQEGSPDSGIQFCFSDMDIFGIIAALHSPIGFDSEHYITEDLRTDNGLKGIIYTDISNGHASVYYMFELNGQDPHRLNVVSGTGPYYFAVINMNEEVFMQYIIEIENVINSLVIHK